MSHTVYFDNAATTFPKPEEVYSFMDQFYRECGVNVGRGQHKLAAKASALVSDTRSNLLELFHCSNKKVVFTHTATEALNTILRGIQIEDGCTVYISPFEHNAVTRVLYQMQKNIHMEIEQLSVVRDTIQYDLNGIKKQFEAMAPSVVIVSHASNVCGVVAPIHQICTIAKQYHAITVIDMCQTAGLVDTDLSSNDIDFAVFAGHKTLYGPFGIAGFICAETAKFSPLLFGGTGVDSANQELPGSIPERYEVASPNIQAISGLYAALQWIKKTSITEIYRQEQMNRHKLLELLRKYDNVQIVAPDEAHGIGVVSCIFDGYSSDNIGNVLSEKDIAVRTGLHCAPYAHRFLGTFPAGTVRFSVSYFNTDDDFEQLASALDYIADNA
jgi:cysteine desulfurase family protein